MRPETRMVMSLSADGSAASDSRPRITIDRTDDLDRMRFVCPNGHTRWDPTNSHLYCYSCYRAHENGADVSPEHWELTDKRSGESIPWSAVVLEEE